jgi:hypothetical protein
LQNFFSTLKVSRQAKIAGRFWDKNQKRTGNCECTRGSCAAQQKTLLKVVSPCEAPPRKMRGVKI